MVVCEATELKSVQLVYIFFWARAEIRQPCRRSTTSLHPCQISHGGIGVSSDGMGPSSKFQSQFTRSKPISVIEFANALLTTWQAAGSNQKRVTTFGMRLLSYDLFP